MANERCFLTDNNDPYFYLSPLKKEVLMKEPMEIYMYHGVATEEEMITITTQASLKVCIQIVERIPICRCFTVASYFDIYMFN